MTRKQIQKLTLSISVVVCTVLILPSFVMAQEAPPAPVYSPESAPNEPQAQPVENQPTQFDQQDIANETSDEKSEPPHEGVFFRLQLGIGYGAYIGSGKVRPRPGIHAIRDPHHQGPVHTGIFSLGGSVDKNLMLHADLAYSTLFIYKNEPSRQRYGSLDLGGGMTYYFMPYNLFFTGSLRFAVVSIYYPGAECTLFKTEKYDSPYGIGAAATFGKEWRVGDHAGFGIALQVNHSYTTLSMLTFHKIDSAFMVSASFD